MRLFWSIFRRKCSTLQSMGRDVGALTFLGCKQATRKVTAHDQSESLRAAAAEIDLHQYATASSNPVFALLDKEFHTRVPSTPTLPSRFCPSTRPMRQGKRHGTRTAWRVSATHFVLVLTTKIDPTSGLARGLSQPNPVVFVVDDDAPMREALTGLISATGLRVECFASADEFLRRAVPDAPSCLVLDVRMPNQSGFELQHELAAGGRDIPVIFITGHGDIQMAVRAMKAGAFEFLPKPFRGDDLLTAIHQAIERNRQARAQGAELALVRERRDRLTAREFEIMARIASGKLNKQIAAELGVSENTIKAHRRHIMKKMGAANFAELMLMIERLL